MKTFTAKEARHAMLDEPGREMVRVASDHIVDRCRYEAGQFENFAGGFWWHYSSMSVVVDDGSKFGDYHWLDEWEAEKAASKAANVRLSRETRDRITMDDVVIYETFLVYDVIPAIRREMEKK